MKNIVVGMSGGIDSSVAAYLLKKDYRVQGISLKMFDDIKTEKSIEDAKRVAEKIGIDHNIIDVREKFNKEIIDYFVDSYIKGNTPNPCPRCNKLIKFYFLNVEAEKIDAKIATGHYIKTYKDEDGIKITSAIHRNSQEYFLSLIDKNILDKLVFPLSNLTKDEVIKIGIEIGLDFITKKESSQDICFIETDHLNFIKKFGVLKEVEGYIKHEDGTILGKHNGYFKYTIGQRKGLGISYKYPLYVTNIIPEKNEVIVGPRESLINKEIRVKLLNTFFEVKEGEEYEVKIRYKTPPINSKIKKIEDDIVTISGEFVAPAKGQLAVFYKNGYIVCGGDII